MNIPRPEHPKPQFMRDSWLNLNGEWNFCIDNGRSGQARKFFEDASVFDRKITVPFCLESELSGIGIKDFTYGVWYRKEIVIPDEYRGKRTVLHFGAADHKTTCYVNGKEAGVYEGGYVSFFFDITPYLTDGTNVLTVYCEDDTRDTMIPRGKQSEEYFSHGCDYTRTTGIWQTVWLEFTERSYIKSFRFYPEYRTSKVTVIAELEGCADYAVGTFFEGRATGGAEIKNAAGQVQVTVDLTETHLWNVGAGNLYDVTLTFGQDTVHTYFGLRNIWFDGMKFMLNGKSVFQRLLLDQGFYPDGIYTAPTDEALHNDIVLSKNAGFNGARLHQKVFEERFLYHADREGYLVWGEYPNWGLDHTRPEAIYGIMPEWINEVNRDFNHPSIIGWCPFNETWDRDGKCQYDGLIAMIYRLTKAADNTRPCIDSSGNFHVETDIFCLHDYEQDPEVFRGYYDKFANEDRPHDRFSDRQTYIKGTPVFISEYGGIKWSPAEVNDRNVAWGYGNAPKDGKEYMDRYKGLTDALLDNPKFFGFCYTQLTDVEQEQNGIYTYNREEKFPSEFFRSVNTRKAAIED